MAAWDLIADYAGAEDGVITTSPSWVVAVFSFKKAITFDRSKLVENADISSPDRGHVSETIDPSDLVRTKAPLIISSDCIQFVTQTTKATHVSTMSATLVHGAVDYVAEILPGDWVMAWVVNSPEQAADLRRRIGNREACNNFMDGLKFVGRCQSLVEGGQIDGNSGHLRTHYYLQAVGFRELDTTVFYDPAFARRFPTIGDWLGSLNKDISDFITLAKGVDVNKAVPLLFALLLGEGLPRKFTNPSGQLKIADGSDAPFGYVIPTDVATILGREPTAKKSGVASYADIVDMVIGLQRYTGSTQSEFSDSGGATSMFIPDGISASGSSIRNTNIPLMGTFLPSVPQFTNKTVWSILSQYLNPAINEMYTCLRVNANGQIVPHVVVRQYPFTTPRFADGRNDVTPFHELPRWKIDKRLVRHYEVGRSNAVRFNFIHVYGLAPLSQPKFALAESIVRAPPIRDDIDIQRHGLYADMMEVSCDIRDQITGPSKWLNIRADWQLNLHLTRSGSITLLGVQAPICEGDNVEFNGAVYHIESVGHHCSVDASGRKTFATTLTVSHGMTSEEAAQASLSNSIQTNEAAVRNMYPGLGGSQRGLQAGLTYEGSDEVKLDESGEK